MSPSHREPDGVSLHGLEFGDTRMRRNAERAVKLMEKDIPFMILGETGTGKDLFAKAVHMASPRRDKPFVAVNCASIPETLIESELFGYRPGAFTGASREGSRGKIVQAHGGTLFLDEIGDMPIQLQARLLRVLEEREVIPLGGETPIKVDIHFISATHQDLKQQVEDGALSQDLYYRLHGISLLMPPLRNREDRFALIRRLMDAEAGGPGRIVTSSPRPWRCSIELRLAGKHPPVAQRAAHAHWPVRERPASARRPTGRAVPGPGRWRDAPAASQRSARCGRAGCHLRELEAAHWNVTRVATKLTLSRNTLYRKMKRYGIKPSR